MWFQDTCSDCRCNNGEITCKKKACPTPASHPSRFQLKSYAVIMRIYCRPLLLLRTENISTVAHWSFSYAFINLSVMICLMSHTIFEKSIRSFSQSAIYSLFKYEIWPKIVLVWNILSFLFCITKAKDILMSILSMRTKYDGPSTQEAIFF